MSAGPGDPASLAEARAASSRGDHAEAARRSFEAAAQSPDALAKGEAEFVLAESLQRAGLPFAALAHYASIVRAGPTHPKHLKSVEALVTLQQALDDEYLAPSILNAVFDDFSAAWVPLPAEVLARINYLIGRVSFRRGALEDARHFFEAVAAGTGAWDQAQYSLGVVLADPRLPAAGDAERRQNALQAQAIFERLYGALGARVDAGTLPGLTALALGRLEYSLGDYARAAEWYGRVPRFSTHWDAALFEGGYARFQADDLGGALGSLQGLFAPQFAGAFQPEAWILTATIYAFACLYAEARSTLESFERRYAPMGDALRTILERPDADARWHYRQVADPAGGAWPRPVWNWVRADRRMLSLFSVVKQIDAERARVGDLFSESRLTDELRSDLAENRATLEQVAGTLARTRLSEAQATVQAFLGQAEIIRFELAKSEKEQAEAGGSASDERARRPLFRPPMPSARWQYWPFEGEFWRDEIGFHQYTLKRACPGDR